LLPPAGEKYGSKFTGAIPWEKTLSYQLKRLATAGKLVKVKASYKLGEELKKKSKPKKPRAVSFPCYCKHSLLITRAIAACRALYKPGPTIVTVAAFLPAAQARWREGRQAQGRQHFAEPVLGYSKASGYFRVLSARC